MAGILTYVKHGDPTLPHHYVVTFNKGRPILLGPYTAIDEADIAAKTMNL
jgi:hypothetical protein